MKKLFLFSFLIVACLVADKAWAVETDCDSLSDSSEQVKCQLVNYMDNKVDDILDMHVCEESYCDEDKASEDYYDVFQGMFYREESACPGSSYSAQIASGCVNNRNQEAIYTLAFLYKNDYSEYQYDGDDTEDDKDDKVLESLNRGLTFLARAQSEDGKLTERGWCGVDYLDVDGDGNKTEWNVNSTYCNHSDPTINYYSPAMGFTYYAAAQALNVLYDDDADQFRDGFRQTLNDDVDSDGDGTDDTPRQEVYACLLYRGDQFLQGDGRGTAPNQDAWALLALRAMKEAYRHLTDKIGEETTLSNCNGHVLSTPLVSDSTLDSLRNEIFAGSPALAADFNGFDRWFTDNGYLLEWGYQPTNVDVSDSHNVGYDDGYVWVALQAMALLEEEWDSGLSTYVDNLVDRLKYFLYVDLDIRRGVFQVSAISRRNWGHAVADIVTAGLLQDDYSSMRTVFNALLEHMVEGPSDFFDYAGVQLLRSQFYSIADLVRNWETPTSSSYTLPLNNSDNFSVEYTETDQDGITEITLLSITKSGDTVTYSANDWWNGGKTYTLFDDHSTITIPYPEYATCDLYGQTLPFACCSGGNGSDCSTDDDDYENIESCNGRSSGETCPTTDLTLTVEAKLPCERDDSGTLSGDCGETTSIPDVDSDNDDVGNYFDSDDDGDGMPDTWEKAYGLDPLNENDGNSDSDGDGVSNYNEYVNGTNPTVDDYDEPVDTDSDDDGVLDTSDNCVSVSNADQTDTDSDGQGDACDADDDNDGLSDESDPAPQDPDYDDDGLNDGDETSRGTNPSDADSDDDGLNDGDEVNTYGTDPLDSDTDNDGVSDGDEVGMGTDPNVYTDVITPILELLLSGDNDGDGYDSTDDGGEDCVDDDATIHPGAIEVCGNDDDENCDGVTASCDTDGDGVSDDIDLCPTSSPLDANDIVDANGCTLSEKDSDGDSLNDYEEIQTYDTNPDNADSDNDSLSDGDEVNTHNTDPNDTDTDNDSISDYMEIQMGTDPTVYTDIATPILNLLLDGDDDGDGYDSEDDGGEDCVDDDATIHPGATEICGNDADENCDGITASCDTDGDGVNDTDEIVEGSDPNDPSSTACVPPTSGTEWPITRDCTVMQDKTWSGDLYIQDSAVVTIPLGISLDLDFSLQKLVVSTGSGVLIEEGGSLK